MGGGEDEHPTLLTAIREELARDALAQREDPVAFGAVVDELRPFVEAAARALRSDDPATRAEFRSVAWLLAYRAGDQGIAALALEALLRAWRSRMPEGAGALLDAVRELVLDGYARGREDRCRASLLAALGASLPVVRVASGVYLAVVAGPLEVEGAEGLAERVGGRLLREGARSVVLHLHGLPEPRLDVLAALWSVATAARVVGCTCVVTGACDALRTALDEGTIPREPVMLVEDERAAFAAAYEVAGVVAGALPAPVRWLARVTGD